jgi:hypothetical protein
VGIVPVTNQTIEELMNIRRSTSRLTLAATTALVAGSSCAHAGELFLLGLVPYSYAEQPSADGRIVVGYDQVSAWYWTRETWVVRLDQSLGQGKAWAGTRK